MTDPDIGNVNMFESCSRLLLKNGNELFLTKIYGEHNLIEKIGENCCHKSILSNKWNIDQNNQMIDDCDYKFNNNDSNLIKLKPIYIKSHVNFNDDNDDDTNECMDDHDLNNNNIGDLKNSNVDNSSLKIGPNNDGNILPTLNSLNGNDVQANNEIKSENNSKIPKQEFKCPLCPFSFNRLYNLKRHCRTHTSDRPYACKYCGNMFKRKKTLKLHYRIHTGEKPYQCPVCPYSSTQSHNVYKHIRIHTGQRPFKCDHCDKTFYEKHALKLHSTIHDDKQFKCEYCHNIYSRLHTLRAHMFEKHKIERDREYEQIVADTIVQQHHQTQSKQPINV